MEKYKAFHLNRVFLAIRHHLIESHGFSKADFSRYAEHDYVRIDLYGQEKEEVIDTLWALVNDLDEVPDEIDQSSATRSDTPHSHSNTDRETAQT